MFFSPLIASEISGLFIKSKPQFPILYSLALRSSSAEEENSEMLWGDFRSVLRRRPTSISLSPGAQGSREMG